MNKDDKIISSFLPKASDPIKADLPEVELLKIVLLNHSTLSFEEYWDIVNEYRKGFIT